MQRPWGTKIPAARTDVGWPAKLASDLPTGRPTATDDLDACAHLQARQVLLVLVRLAEASELSGALPHLRCLKSSSIYTSWGPNIEV